MWFNDARVVLLFPPMKGWETTKWYARTARALQGSPPLSSYSRAVYRARAVVPSFITPLSAVGSDSIILSVELYYEGFPAVPSALPAP